jgi:hypothetical protein
MEEFAAPTIWIAMPAYGSILQVNFVTSLISSLTSLQCIGDLQFFAGDSLVNRARNTLVSLFMAGRVKPVEINGKHEERLVKHDWLLFIDTDLVFNPGDIQRLYELAVKTGPGVYAGTYPLKTLRPKVVFNPLPGQTPNADGVVAVREAGTGFMMIHRDVFTKMRKAYPENDFIRDGGSGLPDGGMHHDWFEVGVKKDANGQNPRFLSEDWFFCQKWADMGGVTLMDTKICAHHIGQMVYPVNPQEIVEVAALYTANAKKVADAA